MKQRSSIRIPGYKATTEEELLTMLSRCKNDKEYGLLIVYANSGLRLKENILLNIGDVQNPDGSIKDIIYVRPETAKNHKARHAMLTDETREAIAKVIQWNMYNGLPTEPSDPLWWSHVNTVFTKNGKREFMKGWFRMSKHSWYRILWRIRPNTDHATHSLRHRAARKIYLATGDLTIAQGQLGHSSLEMTSRYLQPSQEERLQIFKASMPRIIEVKDNLSREEELVTVG